MKKVPNKILLLALGLSLAASSGVSAQQQTQATNGNDGAWSLLEAVNYAKANNLQVKQNGLNRNLNQAELTQSLFGRLPNISASGSFGSNSGSFQDPVTFSLLTQSAQTGNFSLSANLPLFAGFQQTNAIKQNRLLLQASEQEYLSAQNDVTIQVVTAYLNILFANELMKTSELQRSLTQQQLERTRTLFRAGSVAENAVLDLESQFATDELNLITAQNQRDVARLSLMQLLNIPTTENFEIEIPAIPDPDQAPVLVDGNQVFEIAEQTLPAIKAVDLRSRSSEIGVDVARGAYYPRLSIFAGLGSRYSSASQFLTGRETTNFGYLRQEFFPNADGTGTGTTVYVPSLQVTPVYGDYPFIDQLKDNINQQVGVSLQIPIFNGLQVRTGVARAQIARENARVNADIARNNLRQTIEQAYVDAVAAQRRYVAAKEQVNASEKNFRNAELRLNSGVINAVDFNVIANTYRSAQSSLLQAKYEYTFKLKVLDFYQGKELSL
ncbi:TolC family protein [Pontibacter sp. SGAir0037]|uniref:TolC family protein n=1 Tax=Pontibacter sp. SGAir0037 TaxID=2571030 RepID=UPI0010CCC261|nr:TolC family protein [Pontibacter sp. SGAir0037]QCR21927.1 TolC family protein [Pontibacter sp. SGAir0037]